MDDVRVSRAGHTFHERWTARRALQLVFPKDELFAIVVEGLSPNEQLKLGPEAEEIADLQLSSMGREIHSRPVLPSKFCSSNIKGRRGQSLHPTLRKRSRSLP